MIKADGLTKSFSRNGEVFKALDSINLSFPSRGFFSIEGESGAGKSTLLNELALIGKPDSGHVYYEGVEATKKNASKLLKQYVSFVPQEGGLIEDLSVEQNLSFLTNDSALVGQTLKRLGLDSKFKTKVCELSGGEKKRVCIARCILKNSSCIFMDEPTADLDEDNARGVFEIGKQLSATHLVVFTTHDKELARHYCDGHVVLREGEIIEDSLGCQTLSSETDDEASAKAKIPLRTAFPFILNTMQRKKGRVLGSLLASVLSLCVFSVLYSIAFFKPEKAFSSAMQSSEISFIPLLENLGTQNSGLDEWFPIRQKEAENLVKEFETATPYIIGEQAETNLPIFLFPYQSGMKFEGIEIKEPKIGECVCTSFLATKQLSAKLMNDFSSVDVAYTVSQNIEIQKQAKAPDNPSNLKTYYEGLMQNFSYVIVNQTDFSNTFTLTNSASLPASNFLADATVPSDRYFKDKVSYGTFTNQTVLKGRSPDQQNEAIVSRAFLSRMSLQSEENEIIGKEYFYRESQYTDKGSPYFRKSIALYDVLGSITVVGITDSEECDVILNQSDAEKVAQELLYFSGGVAVSKSSSVDLPSKLASFHYASSLDAFSPVYQAQQFRNSPVNKILFAGALATLVIALIATATCIIALFQYRENAFSMLRLIGVNAKSVFLLFSSFGLCFSIISCLLGSFAATLLLFLLNQSLFGVLRVYSFVLSIPLISIGLLLFACAATHLLWISKSKKFNK